MSEMNCKGCGVNENRIYGFCGIIECKTSWKYEDDIRDLTARIAELKMELEKLKKEEIDRTKLSPTATELIAKYGNASTTIGGTFVLRGDFVYRDKAKKELEEYITKLETQIQELKK